MEYYVDHYVPFLGRPLANLKIKPGILVACIVRNGHTIIANGSTSIAPGDNVIIVARKGKVKSLMDIR
jgi:trk system potassium uptake protein TrkA